MVAHECRAFESLNFRLVRDINEEKKKKIGGSPSFREPTAREKEKEKEKETEKKAIKRDI